MHNPSWIGIIKKIFDYLRSFFSPYALLRMHIYNFITYEKAEVFGNILIETHSFCNRECGYCPVGYYNRVKSIMPDEVFYGLIGQLSRHKYKGEVGLHGYNEPLLDNRLADFIRYIRLKCPKSFIYFGSNADLLNKDILRILIKSGLNRIIIQYEGSLRDSVKNFYTQLSKIEKKSITMGRVLPHAWRNRAGSVPNKQIKNSLKLICSRPEFQVVINSQGKVVLCCNDFFGKEVMGDIKKDDIFDIWVTKRFQEIRKGLRRGNREKVAICSGCDWPFTMHRLPKSATLTKIRYLDYI